ncbi:DUF3429 domain-containing protein [Rhizobium straminoryzae]|nr:DUF3429 domain-containing protein [Rhizobium straminoryzae]
MSTALSRPLTRSLTYAGALPFLILMVPGLPFFDAAARLSAFLAYGAVIAGFMAGTLWGLVQRDDEVPVAPLIASNVLALAAWASLLLSPGEIALAVQFCAFLGLLAVDRHLAGQGLEQSWYWQLRLRITGIVCLAYAVRIVLG